MDERWQRVEDLARSALERDPGERAAFLDSVCRGEPELRPKVDELVATYELARTGNTVLSRPGFVPPPAVELESGTFVGPYRILERAGEGSVATIYRALRGEDPGQVVALKVARRGFDTACLARQFETERRALERLRHPNVARFYGAGTLGDGRPYVVLEYVDGLAIDEYCRRERLPLGRRLTLFRELCGAVEETHRLGLVHRDIKSANVLVTRDGVPKLLDFGIAVDLADAAASAASAERPMTPQYASPEQIRGGVLTTRSDVYSLGVVLYELLAGRLPYGDLGMGPREMARVLESGDPPPPSAIAEPEASLRQLDGELDSIVLRALAQEPEGRYESAIRLCGAIGRWLDGV